MTDDDPYTEILISDALIEYIVATVITQLLSSGQVYPMPRQIEVPV